MADVHKVIGDTVGGLCDLWRKIVSYVRGQLELLVVVSTLMVAIFGVLYSKYSLEKTERSFALQQKLYEGKILSKVSKFIEPSLSLDR